MINKVEFTRDKIFMWGDKEAVNFEQKEWVKDHPDEKYEIVSEYTSEKTRTIMMKKL
jgi:hypothetical protein